MALIGSGFLKEILPALTAMKRAAMLQKKKNRIPYIYRNYNIASAVANFMTKGLCNIFNPFVEVLNELENLPKYVVFLPDKDLITSMVVNRFDTGFVMGASLHYLIRQVDMFLNRRRMDLMDKKLGTLIDGYPKVIWV